MKWCLAADVLVHFIAIILGNGDGARMRLDLLRRIHMNGIH